MVIDYELEYHPGEGSHATAVFNFSVDGDSVARIEIETHSDEKITELKRLAVEAFSAKLHSEINIESVKFNFKS